MRETDLKLVDGELRKLLPENCQEFFVVTNGLIDVAEAENGEVLDAVIGVALTVMVGAAFHSIGMGIMAPVARWISDELEPVGDAKATDDIDDIIATVDTRRDSDDPHTVRVRVFDQNGGKVIDEPVDVSLGDITLTAFSREDVSHAEIQIDCDELHVIAIDADGYTVAAETIELPEPVDEPAELPELPEPAEPVESVDELPEPTDPPSSVLDLLIGPPEDDTDPADPLHDPDDPPGSPFW